jgi:hypothetical protein
VPVVFSTKATCLPSGDQETSRIFGAAGSPVTARAVPPVVDCSASEVA